MTYGQLTPINGQGEINVTPSMQLNHVQFVPDLSMNLLSVSEIIKQMNCRVIFDERGCIFQDRMTGKIIGSGYEGVYRLQQGPMVAACRVSTTSGSALQWHRRLGHPSLEKLCRLIPHASPTT